jgi:hypothetical protein
LLWLSKALISKIDTLVLVGKKFITKSDFVSRVDHNPEIDSNSNSNSDSDSDN